MAATKPNTSKVNKKTDTSILAPKKEDIVKDLLKLKNTVKNSKIKTTKIREINTKKHYDYYDTEYKGMRVIVISNSDKDKILSVKEDLNVIRQNLSDIINGHKTQNE